MSEPAFLPSNTHAHAQTTNHFLRGDGGGTTLTRRHTPSSSNTRRVIGRRRASEVFGSNSNNNQKAVTPLVPAVPPQPATKRLHIFKAVAQQQQQQSGSTIPRVPATRRHIHNLPDDDSGNGSQTESTTTAPSNPWMFIPHASQPGSITVSNGEGAPYPTSLDTQQPPQQQQQQKRRQLPFNSLPATATASAAPAAGALTRKRTNSASSTSTTSVTYLRDAAAAFIATAHQNHFQFPHKVLHPEILPLSTANLDLQHDFDSEDDDESFTSRELRSSLPRDVGMELMGGGGDIRDGIEQEFMMEDDDDDGLEDDRGRAFESTTPPLDLGQIVNSEERLWRRRNHYDPRLFLSTTAPTTDAAVDAIASSDTPLFPPSSSYRPSPHITTTTGQLNSNNLKGYWSTKTDEADQNRFPPSVQDHLSSNDHHLYHLHLHQHQDRKPHQRQMYLFGRQDSTINNTQMQDRSASHLSPPDNNYAYQQEVISDDPSSPLPPPPLSFPSTTSFTSANSQHHPARRTDDANEFVDSADRASWVSEMNSAEDRSQDKQQQQQQQQQPHDHPMSLFSPTVGGNNGLGSGGQVPLTRQDSRSEQDREVFEVCSRRLQLGYTPSQNIHKALVSSIRSSFLASLNESQRASLMNGDSPGVQQSTPGDEDLQDFQQPWYKPQHLPYYASPAQEHASRSFEKETRQSREEELLEVIAQLEKDLQELHSSSVELQTRLHESEQQNERMVVEHDCALRRVREQYDHQIHDTKKRTKRFFDETMRKRQRDEDKRLEGLQEQLAQTQATNKDLRTTIRGLQRERLDVEQDQRDDLLVLCLFIENELSPMVFDLAGDRDGSGVTQLQAVGDFKRRPPSTINTATTAIAKSNLYDRDLTPTTAVPHPVPIPLPTPPSQDNPQPKSTTAAITGQCTSPRGQKCMSLLEQLQSALSIVFANTTAVTTPTTPTTLHSLDKASSIPRPEEARLQQEESPKTPAPFRKTHSRHTSTATKPTTTIATMATTKHGRHNALTEDHLVRLHETERPEGLNSRWARKRSSDSSSASSGHTIVAPALPPMPFRKVVVSKLINTSTTAAATPPPPLPPKIAPRVPSASEKPPALVSISNPNNATTTAVSRSQKHTPLTTTTITSSPPPTKTNTKSNNTVDTEEKGKEKEENEKEKGKGKEKEKEKKDRSLQQCLAEQHTRYQKEIERIKQQCINIYRQSLEDVRTDMKLKLRQTGRGGGGGGGQIRRTRSTTTATAAPVVATATAH